MSGRRKHSVLSWTNLSSSTIRPRESPAPSTYSSFGPLESTYWDSRRDSHHHCSGSCLVPPCTSWRCAASRRSTLLCGLFRCFSCGWRRRVRSWHGLIWLWWPARWPGIGSDQVSTQFLNFWTSSQTQLLRPSYWGSWSWPTDRWCCRRPVRRTRSFDCSAQRSSFIAGRILRRGM